MTTRIHLHAAGLIAERGGRRTLLPETITWDRLVVEPEILNLLTSDRFGEAGEAAPDEPASEPLAPIGRQEVWAAGVTYLRSRQARMHEAQASGAGSAGGDFYDRVYEAARPELFFKATPHRVVGPGGMVRIRRDARWTVPEPELALLVNPRGRIIGYTIGNDMSSRDIEGENPLYLPQAKVYDGCCALGPCVLLSDEPPPPSTTVSLSIRRDGQAAFSGSTTLAQMKRGFTELVEYLFRDNSFPHGCWLLTGTGVVPPDSFSLRSGDEIAITIDPIGTLLNSVA